MFRVIKFNVKPIMGVVMHHNILNEEIVNFLFGNLNFDILSCDDLCLLSVEMVLIDRQASPICAQLATCGYTYPRIVMNKDHQTF